MNRAHIAAVLLAGILLAALTLFVVAPPSPFVHARGQRLLKGWRTFSVRGAALMDDATLWSPSRALPDPDAVEERDVAFTAVGGMNALRLAVKMDYFLDEAGAPREAGFAFLDRVLALAEKFSLLVLVDMHIPPGGATQDYRPGKGSSLFWEDPALMDRFVEGWRLIARRYRDERRILGFELMNEPAADPESYWALMGRTIAAIRGVDPPHLLVLQPARDFVPRPIPDRNAAYSIHFYTPLSFTHQNVPWAPEFRSGEGVRYPGPARDAATSPLRPFDRAALRGALAGAASHAARLRTPLLLGEFGVSTSADEESIARWVGDVVHLAEGLCLAGYLSWRQIDPGEADLSLPANSTMAIINRGGYFSPAQFFGIRPAFARSHRDFDGRSFYLDYNPPSYEARRTPPPH